jgi:thioredoxin-dependent peroxiredoxin
VNRDTSASHAKWRGDLSLQFPLLADTDEKLCNAFGTLVEREHEGKKFMGVQRSTFLIDPAGIIQKVWPKVDVIGHAADVLASLVQLTAKGK